MEINLIPLNGKESILITVDLVTISISKTEDKLFEVRLYVNNSAYKAISKTLLNSYNTCVGIFMNEIEEYELNVKCINIIKDNITYLGVMFEIFS